MILKNELLLLFFLFINFKQYWGFPGGSEGKASACNAGDPGLIPGLGKSPGEGNGNPLQHCLGILAWEIPWTEDPGGPQFTGSKI